ncbi:hypothetical protein D3C77_682610 [compost metagenome]
MAELVRENEKLTRMLWAIESQDNYRPPFDTDGHASHALAGFRKLFQVKHGNAVEPAQPQQALKVDMLLSTEFQDFTM